MTTQGNTDDEADLVRCELCPTAVWLRKDRLQKHIQKVHPANPASKKSFTTYKARIASTFPPRAIPQPGSVKQNPIKLISRECQRIGKGVCSECGLEQVSLWRYSESNQGPVEICGECKTKVFDRSFG